MKKVLLTSVVFMVLFGTILPISAEESGSVHVSDIENNEVPQGTTDDEARKVIDALLEHKSTQSALDQQVIEAKIAPIGQDTVIEDQAGNKVLVIGEGTSATSSETETKNPASTPSSSDEVVNDSSEATVKSAGTIPSKAANSTKSVDRNKSKQSSTKKEEKKSEVTPDEEEGSLPKTSAVK